MQDFKYLIPIFLPPNTTSSTQPLDGGIIASFKLFYRTHLLDYVCERIDMDMQMETRMAAYAQSRDSSQMTIRLPKTTPRFTMNEINMIRIVPWINRALEQMKPSMIQKCFYKTLKMDMFKPTSTGKI